MSILTNKIASALRYLSETADSTRDAYLDGLLHEREYLMRNLYALYTVTEVVSDALAEITPTAPVGSATDYDALD